MNRKLLTLAFTALSTFTFTTYAASTATAPNQAEQKAELLKKKQAITHSSKPSHNNQQERQLFTSPVKKDDALSESNDAAKQ